MLRHDPSNLSASGLTLLISAELPAELRDRLAPLYFSNG